VSEITGSDSRVDPTLLTQIDPGEVRAYEVDSEQFASLLDETYPRLKTSS
jgi:hypothetical protein